MCPCRYISVRRGGQDEVIVFYDLSGSARRECVYAARVNKAVVYVAGESGGDEGSRGRHCRTDERAIAGSYATARVCRCTIIGDRDAVTGAADEQAIADGSVDVVVRTRTSA